MRRRTYELVDIENRQGKYGVSGWLVAICLIILILVVITSVIYYSYSQVERAYVEQLYIPAEDEQPADSTGFNLLVAGVHPSTYPEPDLDQLTYAARYQFDGENDVVSQTFYSLADRVSIGQQADITLSELPQWVSQRDLFNVLDNQADLTADYAMYVSFNHIRPVVDFFGTLTVELKQPITIYGENFSSGEPLELTSRQVSLLVAPQADDDWFKLQERQQAVLEGVIQAVSNQSLSPNHLSEMIFSMKDFITTTLPFNLVVKYLVKW